MRRTGWLFRMTIVVTLIHTGNAWGGYVDNFADWQKIDTYGRIRYAQGQFDDMTGYFSSDDQPWMTAQRIGITSCAYKLSITANMLSDAVTKHYQDNLGDWSLSPVVVLHTVTQRICLSYINEERTKYGLGPWPVRTGPIIGAD
ncbi:UNVERIFIED_ORG: hypothetical protein M2312_002203 [Rhizobium esperanzae]|nr:hypothetical protein [Rhizobium esperanzae]